MTGAAAEVSSHLAYITDLTSQTVEAANAAANQLATFTASALEVSVNIDNVPGPASFEAPDKPRLAEIELLADLDISEFAPTTVITPIGYDPAPVWTGVVRDPGTVEEPDFTDVVITPAPDVDFSEAPPDYVTMDPPVLGEIFAISIPNVPPLEEIEFEGVMPSGVLPSAPSLNFDFYEDEYSSDVLDALRAKIIEIFDGGTGLPAAVAQAIRDGMYEAVDQAAEQALQAVEEEWASRGWNLPQGPQQAQMRRVRTDKLRARSKAAADVFIKETDVQIDMLKTAMATGIALEDILIKAHMAVQQRRLDAARALIEATVSIFNAQIARENLVLAQTQAFLALYEGKLRGAQMKLDQVKTQIESQALIGQINEQTVKIYTEGFRALEAHVEVFKAEVQGFEAKTNAKRAILDGYKAYVDGQRAVVEVNVSKAQVFAEKVKVEGLYQEAWKTRADVFSARVNAWNQERQIDIERYKAQNEAMRVESDVFKTQLARTDSLLEVERTRIAALTGENQQLIAAYSLASQAATAGNEALLRKYQANLGKAEAEARIRLENGRINSDNFNAALALSIRAKETVAQVYSNMAASFASAINVNASIGDSFSTQAGCTTSINYSSTFE
jgi:hypothetical protein